MATATQAAFYGVHHTPQQSSQDSSGPKVSVKTIVIVLVVLGLIGLVVYQGIKAAKENNVSGRCRNGLNGSCARAIGSTVKTTAVKTAPVIAHCTATGFASPGCIAHTIGAYAQ